jgi:hypothetical protein
MDGSSSIRDSWRDEVRDLALAVAEPGLVAEPVDRDAVRHAEQPGGRVGGRAGAAPVLERPLERGVDAVLREVEVPGPHRQDRGQAPAILDGDAREGVARVRLAFAADHIGSSITGRTSTDPVSCTGIIAAYFRASSRVAHSKR